MKFSVVTLAPNTEICREMKSESLSFIYDAMIGRALAISCVLYNRTEHG